MAWFAKPKSKKEQIEEQRRRRRGEAEALSERWVSVRLLLAGVVFVALAMAVTLVCFVGLSPLTQQLVANQRERVRVVSAFDFSYRSQVLTQRARKLASEQIGPSFRPPSHVLEERMKQAVAALQPALDEYQANAATQNADDQLAARQKLAQDFTSKQGFDLDPNDIVNLTANTTPAQRTEAFNDALNAVHQIVNAGIYDPAQPGFQRVTGKEVIYNFDMPGRVTTAPLLSPEDALRTFHLNLAPLDVGASAKAAVYNLVKQSLAPNIQFDQERTQRAKNAAMEAVKPTEVHVLEGQVLADPNSPVYDSDEQRELLNAYFSQLRDRADAGGASNSLLAQHLLYTLLILLAALAFIKSGLAQMEKSPKTFALAAMLLLLNLALIRIVLGIGSASVFTRHSDYLAILPWLAPTMLAPLLTAVMLGTAPGALMSLVISLLFTMMTGDTLEVLLLNLLASLTAVYFCRDVRVRIRLVRAGLLGGFAAAACAIYLGFLNHSALTAPDVTRQVFAAIFTGLVTAIAAIGLLPVFENIFKITTDITLLELTDFNHPLLRKLQVAAPGTYHHSLMVANLSERAAVEVGANALLCRACSLYHDIGKIVKPEYFTENQRDGFNPHEGVSPSMSALIIKSHISEGLTLSREYKLPRVIQDVIAQHHGTTLIKYFYHKATRQQRLLTASPFTRQKASQAKAAGDGPAKQAAAAAREDASADQSFYRYDGPLPTFKESAIISLADCLEAASRSLRKVTPQAVEELVESLITDRIEDHQLDDSPITILELKKIKSSFSQTLLNMLHSRVQYPGGEEGESPAAKEKAPAAAVEKISSPPAGGASPRSAA